MKKLLSILFLSLGLIAATAHASPAAPVSGKDYTVLASPQPTDVPAGKIEVTEFFWYGCPHCNEFNPYLEAWVKKQGPDVVFKRVPVAFRDDFIPHSKMYHALDALGLATELTPKVFNEIHVNKNYLMTPEDQAKFLAKQRRRSEEVHGSVQLVLDAKRAAERQEAARRLQDRRRADAGRAGQV